MTDRFSASGRRPEHESFPEQIVEVGQGRFFFAAVASGGVTRAEPIATVGPFLVEHTLCARLVALVVRCRIEVSAIRAGVEITSAALAIVAKADAVTGAEHVFCIACVAVHAVSVQYAPGHCQRRSARICSAQNSCPR